jgi:hypothetical protein
LHDAFQRRDFEALLDEGVEREIERRRPPPPSLTVLLTASEPMSLPGNPRVA